MTAVRVKRYTDFNGGDGYDWSLAPAAIPSWGAHGWDLGDWPYVMIVAGKKEGHFVVITRVEGDVTEEWYTTAEERDAAVDRLAEYYWRRDPDRHGDGMTEALARFPEGELPEHFKGRYKPGRCTDYISCEWREDKVGLVYPVVRVKSASHFIDEVK